MPQGYPANKKEIFAAYAAGQSREEIAAAHGMKPKSVYTLLCRLDAPVRLRRVGRVKGVPQKLSQEQRDEIVRRYRAGEHPKVLAREFRCTPCWVWKLHDNDRRAPSSDAQSQPQREPCGG